MERGFKVYCEWCRDYHSTEDVHFLNVEEDIQGRDIMHFECGKPAAWNAETARFEATSSLVYAEWA